MADQITVIEDGEFVGGPSFTFGPLCIDRDALDEECVVQPELVDYFGKRLAQASGEAFFHKNNLKFVEASLEPIVKAESAAIGAKLTVDGVNRAIVCHEKYSLAQEALRQAEIVRGNAAVDVDRIVARGHGLDNLVKLYLAGYFAQVEGVDQRTERVSALEKRVAAIVDEYPLKSKN